MSKRSLTRWFAEAGLIVFSVLLALVIDEAAETRKTRAATQVAAERITKELQRNSGILESWRERHRALAERLETVAANPESPARSQLLSDGFLDLSAATDAESLFDATLSSSAWEAARFKGLAAEMDYETVQQLSAIYGLQRVVSQQTIPRFSTLYFDRETHRSDRLDETITQLRLLLGELLSQEDSLALLYRQALQELPN